jgi:hypothetical protein
MLRWQMRARLSGRGGFGGRGWLGSGFVCSGGCFGFGGLGDAGEVEVLLHGAAGLGGVVGADGAVDLAVHLGGFLEVDGVDDGLAAVLVEVGGDGLHEGAEDGVAGGSGDGAVEADVVDEVLVGVGEGGVHLGNLFGQFGDVLVGGTLGGEGGYVGFDDEARLKHLPGKEAVEGSEDREGAGVERGWARGDEGSGTVAAFEDSHGGEEADAGAKAGTADLELAGELALGWETVAGVDFSAADERANVVDDLHGELTVAGDLVKLLLDLFFCDLFFHAEQSSLGLS